MLRLLVLLFAFAAAGALAGAVGNSDFESADERYERWTRALIAPCCWSESLEVHRSPKADQARQELRVMIDDGMSDREIRDAFAERYGDAILIVPDGERGTWLFVIPVVVLLFGIGVGAWILKRMLRRGAESRAAEGAQ